MRRRTCAPTDLNEVASQWTHGRHRNPTSRRDVDTPNLSGTSRPFQHHTIRVAKTGCGFVRAELIVHKIVIWRSRLTDRAGIGLFQHNRPKAVLRQVAERIARLAETRTLTPRFPYELATISRQLVE
jgi:hypothetical protein